MRIKSDFTSCAYYAATDGFERHDIDSRVKEMADRYISQKKEDAFHASLTPAFFVGGSVCFIAGTGVILGAALVGAITFLGAKLFGEMPIAYRRDRAIWLIKQSQNERSGATEPQVFEYINRHWNS